ncbi:MAG: transporter permease YtrF [Proteobacteria bacterium]|nr:transporter permease YtrF [Pseudomonadota bacterium]
MIAFKLALRNLWKNRRRSLATLIAIALGFAAINLFAGYIHNSYNGLRLGSIYGEGLGHLTIARKGFFEQGSLKPEQFLFSETELARLTQVLGAEAGVQVVSPRLSASGLVSNGKLSTIFIAEGEDPALANRIWRRGMGRPKLDPAQPGAGLVSRVLAERLGVKAGGNLVTLSNTLEGQINALDLDVLRVWDTGTAATNDKSLRLPLSYVQKLLDTRGASRVVVLLDEDADADAARAVLAPRLAAAGFEVDIKTWVELSNYYRQVKRLFDLIFAFLFVIVFVVVLMSIINTLSMSVMERVREIGTLRALGMQRWAVVRIFAAEGSLLGLLGSLGGVVLTLLVKLLITLGHVSYTPPSSSSPVPLSISVLPSMLGVTLLVLCLVATLAACWPARRAAHIEIVDALGHV